MKYIITAKSNFVGLNEQAMYRTFLTPSTIQDGLVESGLDDGTYCKIFGWFLLTGIIKPVTESVHAEDVIILSTNEKLDMMDVKIDHLLSEIDQLLLRSNEKE